MRPSKPFALIALLVAGCTVSVTPPIAGTRAPAARAKASAKPATTAKASPATKASPAVQAAPSQAPGKPALGGLTMPTKLLPEMPASLVEAGGGNLIGPDGASLVGMDGGTLIGMDGASYTLTQFKMPDPAATCGPPEAPAMPGKLIGNEFQDFIRTCRAIEQFLADAASLALVPGVPKTDMRPGPRGKESAVTFLLEQRPEGGLLKVGQGETLTKENLVVSLAFTSADAGVAVYRLKHEMLGLAIGMRVEFDHGTGLVSSDSVMKFGFMGASPMLFRRHVNVSKLPGGGPDAPTMRLTVGSVLGGAPPPCGEARIAMGIHYLADGRAAMQLGMAQGGPTALEYLGLDGVRRPEPGPGTGFFVDKDGAFLSGDVSLAQLAPAMPGKAEVPASLPALPDPNDVLNDPVFEPIW